MGLKEKKPSSPVVSRQRVELAADFTTASTDYVDVTGMSVNLPNRVGGKFMAIFCGIHYNTTADGFVTFRFVDGATNKNGKDTSSDITTKDITLVLTGNLDGQVLKVQCKRRTGLGTLNVEGLADSKTHLEVIEIS